MGEWQNALNIQLAAAHRKDHILKVPFSLSPSSSSIIFSPSALQLHVFHPCIYLTLVPQSETNRCADQYTAAEREGHHCALHRLYFPGGAERYL
jgi:hypothetical protein